MSLKSPLEFKTLIEVATYFKDEKKCLSYLKQSVWRGSVDCPRCKCKKVYHHKDGVRYSCSGCKEGFTLKVGTIFESSKVPLCKWFMAMYLISINKKGCSSHELGKHIGVSQKTAWFMAHRIRKTFKQSDNKLSGYVAIDECFCGGVNGNRHIDKKVKNRKDRTFKDKHTVHGFIDSEGKMKCVVIKSTKNWHIQPSVRRHVEKGSVLITDEWKAYKGLGTDYGGEYEHLVVNHKARKFLSPEGGTTNTVENAWSHLKRMFYGTYNRVSKKHIQKYLDEFTFRFNNRENNNAFKFAYLLSNITGNLTYKQLTHGKEKIPIN
jgi:transposase-like protein